MSLEGQLEGRGEDHGVAFLHQIARRISPSIPLTELLQEVVIFAALLVESDSCFIYVLEGERLVLKASRGPHPDVIGRLKLELGQGVAGWVAEHHEPVIICKNAFRDPRFRAFCEIPEDRFEAFLSVPLSSRGRIVGVMNLQNRIPHAFTEREVRIMSTAGFLIGAEIETARLETENARLAKQLESRKVIERAKAILQLEMKLTEEEAHSMLQRQSQKKRRPINEIAQAIILSQAVKNNF